jgi:hypothetical protein
MYVKKEKHVNEPPKLHELREARKPAPIPLIPEMSEVEDRIPVKESYQHVLAGEKGEQEKFGVRILMRKVVVRLAPRQITWLARYERETEIAYEEHIRRALDLYIKKQAEDPLPKREVKAIEMGANWDEDIELVTFGLR